MKEQKQSLSKLGLTFLLSSLKKGGSRPLQDGKVFCGKN